MSNRLLFSEFVYRAPPQVVRASRRTVRTLLSAVWRRYRSRQQIADLDRHLQKDIGVTFAEAEAEANKSFWRS